MADPPAEAPWGPTGVPFHPPQATSSEVPAAGVLCAARPHVSPAAEWLRWLWEPWMALPHAHNLDLEQSPWKVWHRSPHAPLPAPRSSRASCFTMHWGSPPHSLWAHHSETFHSPLSTPRPSPSEIPGQAVGFKLCPQSPQGLLHISTALSHWSLPLSGSRWPYHQHSEL